MYIPKMHNSSQMQLANLYMYRYCGLAHLIHLGFSLSLRPSCHAFLKSQI